MVADGVLTEVPLYNDVIFGPRTLFAEVSTCLLLQSVGITRTERIWGIQADNNRSYQSSSQLCPISLEKRHSNSRRLFAPA